MMNIGISYWFGYPSLPEERVKLIKHAGFSSVSLHWTNEYKDITGEKREVLSTLIQNDIEVSSFHLSFEKSTLLWSNSADGVLYRKEVMDSINDAFELGVDRIIIHSDGVADNSSLDNLSKIVSYASEKGIILCLENLQHEDNLGIICANENYRNIAICYDVGHNNIRKCPISIKESNVQYFHIHDNDGIRDLHCLPYQGTVDWNRELKSLKLFPTIPKILEIHDKIHTRKEAESYLNKAKELAEKLILAMQSNDEVTK